MKKAVSKGALICITNHQISELPCIVVTDPHEVYTKLCIFYRNCRIKYHSATITMFNLSTTAVLLSGSPTLTSFFLPASEIFL